MKTPRISAFALLLGLAALVANPLTPMVLPGQAAPPAVPAVVPAPSDAELLALLDLEAPGMGKVKQAARPGPDGQVHWDGVRAAYLDYRRTGCPARWKVMPDQRPAASQPADAAGDDVVAHHIHNRYGFQPAEVDMGEDFDWNCNPTAKSDPSYTDEWTYGAISRTEFWNDLANAYWKTGNEKYAAAWVAQLADFAAKNPVRYGPVPGVASLWRTLDSGIRIGTTWPDVYYHFLNSPSLTPEANWLYLRLNVEHARLLLHGLQNLDRSGNWVAVECGGLYTVGALFPEVREAAAWRQAALGRIGRELDRAVPPDGLEAELAPGYHFLALQGLRTPLDVARLNGLPVPEETRAKILSMYRAPVLVMDQSGRDVATNDSDAADAAGQAKHGLELADDPLLKWAASHGKEGVAPPDSTALPYAGFYAMRSGWKPNDLFLFFRGGPTGIGHQHEDMLEIVLRAWNRTLLFDPGSYMYDQSDWRRFALGTAAHNTVIVDGKWQHRGASRLPVNGPTGDPWITTPLFDFVSATYAGGYQQSVYEPREYDPQRWVGEPDKSVSHTRRVLYLKPDHALILDTLAGSGTHVFDAHFHLDAPAARIDPATQAAFSQRTDDVQLALYPLDRRNLQAEVVQGQKDPLLGWWPNRHRAIPTVRFRKQQAAPATFATLLCPYRGEAPALEAKPLAGTGEGVWGTTLQTKQETAEVALVEDGSAKRLSIPSALLGNVRMDAAGWVARRPDGKKEVWVGGWSWSSYEAPGMEFRLDAPGNLLACAYPDRVLFFNAGKDAVTLTMSRPFVRRIALAAGAWVESTAAGDRPATDPRPFPASWSGSSAPSYADYLRGHASQAAARANGSSVVIEAARTTLPAQASVGERVGSGKVIFGWDQEGTVVTGSVDIPQAGWYRVRLRYCSGASPLRSLLIAGKPVFAEADGFALPSTLGPPPSNGWSSGTDDWREIVLGKEQAPDGWRLYLPAGPCQIGLRNEGGGGSNLDWIALDPIRS